MVISGCLINDRYVGEEKIKPIVNIILNGKRLNAFPLKLGTDLFSPLLFYIVLKILVSAPRQEKKQQGNQIDKEEIKVSLFEDNMII